jgi:hypothetical protein
MVTNNSTLSRSDPNLCGNFMAQKCFDSGFKFLLDLKCNRYRLGASGIIVG